MKNSMKENGNGVLTRHNKELEDSLNQIKHYLEINIRDLTAEAEKRDQEINILKQALEKAHRQSEGYSQLINKLLGELSKLQNDIEWYKLTYEKRSFLGTVREKLFRRH
jgi:chaperonin cofactor prefoldin